MVLMERYQKAVDDLFAKVRETQTETIIKAGELIAQKVSKGGKIVLHKICHNIESDLIYRGGGPIFYKKYEEESHKDTLKEGDVLVVSNEEDSTRALMGEVMMAYLYIQKKIAGLI